MSLHPIRLALGVRFLRKKSCFLERGTPCPSALKAGNCRQKRFAGKMYAEEYVSLSWSPAVYRRGKYWSQCAARGSGQGHPPRPWNSPPPLGQGRSLLPPKLELPTSHKKNPFLMIVLLLRISYCTQGIVYCLLECLVVYQLFLVGHGERHDGNDLVRFPDPHYF